jgi:predicted RNA-binding Zn ribbon-like protein
MGGARSRRGTWKFVAGELCLDFANTASWHASDRPDETLHSFEDLLEWCRQAGLVKQQAAREMARDARRHPAAARAAWNRSIALREALYRIVVSLVSLEPAPTDDLAALNRALRSTLGHLRLVSAAAGLARTWEPPRQSFDAPLRPILESAAHLLTSDRHLRIGQCADDRGCGWLYIDTTKNRSRRWCDMTDCGNRAKARRHVERRRRERKRTDRAREAPGPGGEEARGL